MSSDEERSLWFDGSRPSSNLGIVTGRISNLVVLDLDDEETYQQIAGLNGVAPWLSETLHVYTGKGHHLYYRPRPEGTVVRTTSFLLNGKRHHVKAEGGYVVAPPSIHPEGREYVFSEDPLRIAYITMPVLQKILLKAGAEQGHPDTPPDKPKDASWIVNALHNDCPEGGRNEMAARIAGWFRDVIVYKQDVTLEILSQWNELRCHPPLPQWELEAVVSHKYRAYKPHMGLA